MYTEVNFKPQFLIKSGYYILLSPSKALFSNQNLGVCGNAPLPLASTFPASLKRVN